MKTIHYRRISLTVFTALLLTISSICANFLLVFQSSSVSAQTANSKEAEAEKLITQGVEKLKAGQIANARQLFQQALTILRESKASDRTNEVAVLALLGFSYERENDYAKAIEYYQQALPIARQLPKRDNEKEILRVLGEAYKEMKNYKKAIEYYQQNLVLARELKDRSSEANALRQLGRCYTGLKDLPQAMEFYQQALMLARQIKDHEIEAMSLADIGESYNQLKNISRAIEFYQQGLAIAKAIKNPSAAVVILQNFGDFYLEIEDYAAAIDISQQGLAIAREIPDSLAAKKFLDNLGQAYYLLADWDKAIRYCQQSLALAKGFKDPGSKIQPLITLGGVYYYLHDLDKAIDYYQQVLAIDQQTNNRFGEGAMLGNIGLAYATKGEAAKAINYLEKDLAIEREFHNRLQESQTLGYLGGAYRLLKNYSKAVEYHQQSIVIAREVKYTRGEAINLRNLGIALLEFGKLPEAEKNLRDAIDVFESLRKKLGNNDAYKVSIFEQQAEAYQILQKVLIEQKKNNEALEVSEWGRARAFVDLLARRLSTNGKGVTTPEPVIDKPTLPFLQKVAQQENATLVQYSVINFSDTEIYIWVIKPTGEVTFRAADLKPKWLKQKTSLAELVSISRESIGVRGGGVVVSENPHAPKPENQLKHLHELLINPIADLLPSKESDRVIFIPQSSLFLVPFPALQDADGKYLIQKHTILTAPSIQVLDLTHKQRLGSRESGVGSGGKALVVGNPTMPSVPPAPGKPPQQLPSLPGAEKEAQAIAPLLNTKAIIGSQGTKTAIVQKMPQARIIHLATHGILDDIRGLGSAITLAPDSSPPKPGEINGLLTAEEILDMKLQAQLVVLSACDTGRGKITGDGVIGLSRSLISAGVPSVMVSLWSVPDSPTAELMSQFYTNLQQRHMDKAQALRQAMLTTMKTHPSPKDWAAFTLIGESE